MVIVCAALFAVSSDLCAADASPALKAVVDKFPAGSPADSVNFAGELVKMGQSSITELCGMVVATGQGDDLKVRYALSALTWYVARNGADAGEVKMFAGAIADALKTAQNDEVKAFLIRRLHLAGNDESVPLLAGYLGNDRLCDPAVQALLTIHTPSVNEVLLNALPSAEGKRLVSIIKALGELGESKAAAKIAEHVKSSDRDTRHVALYALANIGPAKKGLFSKGPDTEKILSEAMQTGSRYEKAEMTSYYMLYLSRMVEAGDTKQCAELCRNLIKTHPKEANVQCSALTILVSAAGKDAQSDLMALTETGVEWVRTVALSLAETIPGGDVTSDWVKKAKSVTPEVRAEILAMLGRRGDKEAFPALAAGIQDSDKAVRLASITACSLIGGSEGVKAIAKALKKTDQADEAEAVQQVLMNMKGDGVADAIAGALSDVPADVQPVLIEVLSRRGGAASRNAVFAKTADADVKVRVAAIKALGTLADGKDMPRLVDMLVKAEDGSEKSAIQKTILSVGKLIPETENRSGVLLAAMKDASKENRIIILGLLAELGGKDAYAAVAAGTKDADAEIKDASVRALTNWKNDEAGAELINIIRDSDNMVHKVLATRGLVRIVGESGMSSAEKVKLFEDALKAAGRPDEKKLIISGLSGVKTAESLRAVAKCLEDKDIQVEAARAAAIIVCPADDKDKGMVSAEAGQVLTTALPLIADAGLRGKVEAQLKKTGAPVPVVVQGKNLAQGKPVKASIAHEAGNVPEKAVDGNSSDRNAAWFGAGSPGWIQVDLGKSDKIESVRVFFYWDGGRYYQYTVETSNDGENWSKVADMSNTTTPATEKGVLHKFTPVEARYVRINVTKNSANPSIHLVEFEVYGEGNSPVQETAADNAKPEIDSEGFEVLFNGKDMTGWIGDTKGYIAENGVMLCKPGGNLYTEKQYDNFIFRFEFKLTPGANNGLGIRTPAQGDAAYAGMELQILDDTSDKYKGLQPYQYHGSIYGIVPSIRGHQKPVGEWNTEEVIADGSKIKIILNGFTIVDADLSKIEQTDKMHDLKKHPGMHNKKGHIGFLGHGSVVEFRNIRVKKLDKGVQSPPEGFTALFNGKDLTGWKGLVGDPKSRAKMTPEALKEAQAKEDESMRAHWKVEDGVLVFDGKGKSLCTAKDYGNFEMYVDWKIKDLGDSGIYLRGSPQVQIWDPKKWPVGSGGLYNNQKNPSKPSKCADNPIGEWNTFFIKMVGEKVTVYLNDELVVDNVVLENYWDRSIPIYEKGQIELQNHGNTLYFRNVFIREL